MLRPSPTIISLSKRDVREHLENVRRRAVASRCGDAEQPIHTMFLMQPLCNRQANFTGDARTTSWGHSNFQGTSRYNTGEPIRGQSGILDVSFRSRSSDGSDTDEFAEIVRPISQLLSLDDNEDSGTEDVYQLTGLSLHDDDASEGVDVGQTLAFRSPQSRQQEAQENTLGYGGFMRRPSRDSSSFGKSLSISTCWVYC